MKRIASVFPYALALLLGGSTQALAQPPAGEQPEAPAPVESAGSSDLTMHAAAALADSSAARAMRHRWGIGWDGGVALSSSGIALRFRIDPSWGLGAVVYTSVVGSDDEDLARGEDNFGVSDSRSTDVGTSDVTSDAWRIQGFAFHEKPLVSWFAIGPYVGFGYGYSRREVDGLHFGTRLDNGVLRDNRREETETRTSHVWVFSVGVRPSFQFEERFILESRFGLSARWTNSESVRTRREESTVRSASGTETDTSFDRTRDEEDDWSLYFAGQELGPGAVLSFIILF
jgi:hypothetical protein